MININYNPIIPKPFEVLEKSKADLGTHRIVVRGGRYSGKTTTVFEEALEGWTTIKGAHIVVARYDDCALRLCNAVRKEVGTSCSARFSKAV